MSTNPKLSREEIAKREIGVTGISRAQAWTLVAVFIGVIYSVPIVQRCLPAEDGKQASAPGLAAVVQAFRLGALPESVLVGERDRRPAPGLWRRFKVANDQLLILIHRLEDGLKEASFLTRNLVTPVQRLTTRTLGLGNEKGYPGREGWAFFRTGVDALTGPGFLDPKQLERRAASGTEWIPAPEPDPRPAILDLHAYLASRGIDLVLVPVPTKPGIHPEKLSPRYDRESGPVRNPSYAAWAGELTSAGVQIVDPALLLTARKAREAQYLETDTHWTPPAVDAVAEYLVEALDWAPGNATYRRTRQEVSSLGDVAANLLKLEGTDVYPEQTVTLSPVFTEEGGAWTADPGAEILLLGDSFANIYSATNMNWGGSAGLAEQISYHLKRPVDVLAENDAGAKATRLALAKALYRGDRLAGKKVVIWEFAARELAMGDWQHIDWDAIVIPDEAVIPVAAQSGIRVEGTIASISRSPRPGTVTYKDCLVQIHLVDVDGLEAIDELLLNVWGMRDNKLTASDSYAPGNRRTFTVTDWDQAQAQPGLAGTMRRELDDPDFVLIDLPIFFGE